MEPLSCPFESVQKILDKEKGKYDISLLDVHAEATSEKLAIAHCFDGRIDVIFGTHTHVATADERILPYGTGYITDLGMTGPVDSVIGTDKRDVIERFRSKMPTRFRVASGEIKASGAIFELDGDTGRVVAVRRVRF
jgi:calcineurin-like phosphoesterase